MHSLPSRARLVTFCVSPRLLAPVLHSCDLCLAPDCWLPFSFRAPQREKHFVFYRKFFGLIRSRYNHVSCLCFAASHLFLRQALMLFHGFQGYESHESVDSHYWV